MRTIHNRWLPNLIHSLVHSHLGNMLSKSTTTQTHETVGGPTKIHEPDSMDTILKALSNRRRREVIRYLKQYDGTATVRDIAHQLAAWENEIPEIEVSYDQCKRVYTSLHQSHLPKLARDGFIEYNRNRGTVALSPGASELNMFLEVTQEGELLWGEYYFGLSLVFLAAVVAASIGAWPFALVSGYVYAALFAIIGCLSSLYHLRSTYKNAIET